MESLTVLLSFVIGIYAQHPGEHCGSASSGPVGDGVDFVALRSEYDRTGNIVPHMGSSSFAADYEGYKFYFINSTSQAAFNANPSMYMPSYGCYCAWAMVGISSLSYL